MATIKEVLYDEKKGKTKTTTRFIINDPSLNGITVKTVIKTNDGKSESEITEEFHEGMHLSLTCKHNGKVVPQTSPELF